MCAALSVYWFRKALRLHDNPALLNAINAENCNKIACVFVLDPWFVKNARVGCNRWKFLQQSLTDLNSSLDTLGSRLFVIRGTPTEVFGEIFSKYTVKQLAFEVDTEPYALKRDAEIKKLAELSGVKVVSQSSHTLYDLDRAIALNKGEAPKTYQSFCNLRKRLGEPPLPVDTPLKSAFEGKFPVEFMSERNTSTPTDEELGLAEGSYTTLYPGGESEALRRMDENLQRKEWICKFEKPETEPNSLKPSTTVLSPYLKFGCLSVRLFYHQLNEVYKNRKHTEPPVSLHGQLLWREFFYTVAYDTKDFDKMAGNRLCKQIPWGDDEQKFMAWKQGRTGYPFIDAIMRQLAREGWIHHLARHAVACFLTRGDLWISWEKGQQVFEEYLLDADWSLNAGNWLWLSASAFFHQYFRVYSPIAFGKKTDKTGEYIRKYVPELKSYPTQYIYEPWKAPIGVQKSCKCIVGVDYPNPIVDHDKARQENIEKMAKAYKANEGSSKDPPEKQPTAKKRKLK